MGDFMITVHKVPDIFNINLMIILPPVQTSSLPMSLLLRETNQGFSQNGFSKCLFFDIFLMLPPQFQMHKEAASYHSNEAFFFSQSVEILLLNEFFAWLK